MDLANKWISLVVLSDHKGIFIVILTTLGRGIILTFHGTIWGNNINFHQDFHPIHNKTLDVLVV